MVSALNSALYLDLINHPSEALYRNFEPWHSRFTAFVRRHLGSEPVAHTNLGKGFGRPPSPCGSVARYRAHLRVRNSTGAIARTYNINPSQTYLLRSRFKALGRQIVDMLSVTNLLHLECRSRKNGHALAVVGHEYCMSPEGFRRRAT